MLEPGKSDLAHASLQPADVDISDIAAAAEGGARSLEYVVREVHARLADRLCLPLGIQGGTSHSPIMLVTHVLQHVTRV